MPSHTPEETIEEITHSKEVVLTSQQLYSSRRKVFNKYMVAIAIVLLIILASYYFLSAGQLADLHEMLNKDHHLFYWMLLIGFGAEIVGGQWAWAMGLFVHPCY